MSNYYYEKIKADSKKGQSLICRAMRFDGYSVDDCYGRASETKRAIERDWWRECYNLNGENFRIISHNSRFFSLAFEAGNDLYVITPSHNYIVVNAFA